MERHPLVSVGIPTYNRPELLKTALDRITGQTYKNLEIIVSDNCSPNPKVEEVVREFQKRDSRVQYFRQSKNIVFGNFIFVLEKATAEYFMWAADDDEWEKEFIEVCLNNSIEKNVGLSFCGIDNIDTFGQNIRNYPSLPNLSGVPGFSTVFRYLMDPEILGKANMIYGLYKKNACKEALALMKDSMAVWGGDMCFNLAVIAREGLYIDPRVLFHKRIQRATDVKGVADEIIIKDPRLQVFDVNEFYPYLKANLLAVKGTRFYFFTLIVMILRYMIIVGRRRTLIKKVKYFSGKAVRYILRKVRLIK